MSKKKCNLVIAKQKANRKKNHYFTALHEIKNVQTLIEIEGQTCFSAFAGLRVLYLNLSLVSWLSLRVPHLQVPVVVARRRLLSPV